jgi:hypothetical protein
MGPVDARADELSGYVCLGFCLTQVTRRHCPEVI